MVERFLRQSTFTSMDDFRQNLEFIVPEDFNFAYDVMDAWAEEAPDKLALLWTNDKDECRRFTFGDIKRESDKVASYLHSLGIGKNDMVMLIMKRRYQFWTTMIAIHKIGAIAIPATFLLTANDIVYRCKCADIKAVICAGDKQILDHVEGAYPDCPTLEHRISIGPIVPEGWDDFEAGVAQASEWHRPEFVNRSTDYSIMYFTSGTSGEPKMVIHDYTYALAHLTTAYLWHNLTPDSLHLTVADTGWGKAVWGKLYGQWIVGAAIFVYDHEKFTPADILHKMEQYKVTSFCAPPTIYRFMILEDLTKFDLSSLKYCTTAGEALNPSVFEKFYQATGIQLMEGFGQTETTLTLGTFPWMKPKPGSMGVPNPQYDIDILKDDGTRAKVGEHGQIVVRTDKRKQLGLFCEYYRNKKLTEKVWADGIYHTGDIAYYDEDGYYWFVGRADDVIKSSGYRIGPFEVENALMTHPAVVECAITGVPDDIRGMVVKATVVLAEEWKNKAGEALVKELQNHVKHITAPYKYPRVIEFVEALPKTTSGKIRHVEIRNNDAKKNK